MKIKELAALSGITVRTLHHYDEIGLLSPSRSGGAGYRSYTDADLARLQEILFFRELDFPLREIKEILQSPEYDRTEALKRQRQLLLAQRKRLDKLIRLTEQSMKGTNTMNVQEFDMTEIENAKKQYSAEAKQRWGSTAAYAESEAKAQQYTKADWQRISGAMGEIFAAFAALRGTNPAAPEAAALVQRWQAHISSNFYQCSTEILAGLGQMYTADERFTKNIDQYGAGTAQFISDAIAAYCAAQ